METKDVGDDMRRVRKALESQGWTIKVRKGGHDQAIPPDKSKPLVTLAGTPSDWRSWSNMLSQLRRSGFIWPPPK